MKLSAVAEVVQSRLSTNDLLLNEDLEFCG